MQNNRPDILEPAGAVNVPDARRYPRSIRWSDIRAICVDSVVGWSKHNAPRLGAALSFYTLLSTAPLLMILVSIVALVIGHKAAEAGIIQQLQMLVGSQGATVAQSLLAGSRNTAHGIVATVFGLVTVLFGASGVLIELRNALNVIWNIPAPELGGLKEIYNFLKERLFSFAIVLAIGFVLLVSLAISAFIAALGALSASIVPIYEILLHTVNFIVTFAVITGLFSAIYKFLPDARIEWQDVILGGAVTSALFTTGKLALGIYLAKATFASTYGAAGSIVVFIVWVYYSAQIFFLGAEFTRAFAQRSGSQAFIPNK